MSDYQVLLTSTSSGPDLIVTLPPAIADRYAEIEAARRSARRIVHPPQRRLKISDAGRAINDALSEGRLRDLAALSYWCYSQATISWPEWPPQ